MKHIKEEDANRLAQRLKSKSNEPLATYVNLSIIESMRQAGQGQRVIPFVCSTEGTKRDGNRILTAGWELENYLRSGAPVQWCHQTSAPSIGNAPNMRIDSGNKRLICEVIFPPEDTYDFADLIYRLYSANPPIMRAGSVHWLPKEVEPNTDDKGRQIGWTFIRQELFEFSLCPVPADPQAVTRAVQQRLITSDEAQRLAWHSSEGVTPIVVRVNSDEEEKIEEEGGDSNAEKSEEKTEGKEGGRVELGPQLEPENRAVPSNVSDKKAEENTAWGRPALKDFTDKAWGDLTAAERRRIAGHFAWAASLPPERFTDLKLPHHRASDGAIVWNGVRAGMSALLGARGGVDIPSGERRRVYSHLSSHYQAFDKKPPAFRVFTDIEELDMALENNEWGCEDNVTLALLRLELGESIGSQGIYRGEKKEVRGEILDALQNDPDLQLRDAFKAISRAMNKMMEIVYHMKPQDEGNEDRVDAMLDEYGLLTRAAWLTIANSPVKVEAERSLREWLDRAMAAPEPADKKEQAQDGDAIGQEISDHFASVRAELLTRDDEKEEKEIDNNSYYQSFFEDAGRAIGRITQRFTKQEAS